MNRLIKEIRPNNDIYTYTYGITSNMIEEVKKNGNTIKTFNYESGKLTEFTKNGKITNVEYDNYGNITKTDEAIITYNSRNLMDSYEKLNGDKYNYYYNYQGIRFKKQKINGNTINYILDGSRILGEDEVNPSGDIVRKFRYFYDAIGVCGIDYIVNNEHHYFNLIKDSLGNISKVMNHGKYVGEYTYDAWGNCEVSTSFSNDDIERYVVKHNPFRYKGYYYDEETQLFYCNYRYYSSELCRWISPDSIEYLDPSSINGLNLYCYCMNNPIMFVDPSGHAPWWSWALSGLQLVAGVALCFVPGMQGLGASLAIGGATGLIMNQVS